jgi:allene oxide cyclase
MVMDLRRIAVLISAALLGAPWTARAAEHLGLVERATGEQVVHRQADADAVGDLLLFSNPLYDAANRAAAGASRGYCVRVEVGRWWDCHFTLELASGSLLAAGAYPDEGDAEFGIVGGTGRYAGARGTLKVHARDAAHSAYDFAVALQ